MAAGCVPLQEDNEYRNAVFNGTVNIIEIEEGFDTQTYVDSPVSYRAQATPTPPPPSCLCLVNTHVTFPSALLVHRFFMYVFMVSGLALLMFIIHYVYTTVRRVSNHCYSPRLYG